MKHSKISEWFNIGASAAVFLGLLLVAFEIRQANQVAFAEMRNDVNTDWVNLPSAAFGTQLGSLVQKSYEQPNQLSDSEIFDLNLWLSAVMTAYHKQAVLYYDFGWAADPAIYTEGLAREFFSDQFGRAWYLENRYEWHPRLVELLDAEIDSTPISNSSNLAERIRSRMEMLSGDNATK